MGNEVAAEYEMEELIPLVAQRVRKYTSAESTSVPYEKARQILGSILYCIEASPAADENVILAAGKRPAAEAFQVGLEARKEKLKKAKQLFQKIKQEFVDINNEFYKSTLLEGMPEFFKYYDLEFNAQDTILTLDYPLSIMPDASLCGIDMIYEYLKGFNKEQQFLRKYSKEVLHEILYLYHPGYSGLVMNLYEPVKQKEQLCDELEQHRDKLRIMQALREEPHEAGFMDGDMMSDEELRQLIEELRECRYLSDKLLMVRREIHSIRDLNEILKHCFWDEECKAVLDLLTPEEQEYLRTLEDREWD